MLKEPTQKPSSRWNWILWWRIDQDEVEWEAAHYSELGFFKGFKGWSVLALLLSTALTGMLTLFASYNGASLIDVGVMLFLAGFVYLGHRWAMIGAMLVWTLEKAVQFIDKPGTAIVGLIWWAAYMHLFYMAVLVERLRRQPRIDPDVFT